MKKLHSESKEENISEFEKISCKSKDTVSEISELEDVDCSAFVGTCSVGESKEVGNSFKNNDVLDVKLENVCNLDNVIKVDIACKPLTDKVKTTCESNVNNVENNSACETPQNEKVFPEFVKIKDITYKTLKKEGKLR